MRGLEAVNGFDLFCIVILAVFLLLIALHEVYRRKM